MFFFLICLIFTEMLQAIMRKMCTMDARLNHIQHEIRECREAIQSQSTNNHSQLQLAAQFQPLESMEEYERLVNDDTLQEELVSIHSVHCAFPAKTYIFYCHYRSRTSSRLGAKISGNSYKEQ